MKDWWYRDGGGESGPVTQAVLGEMLAQGRLAPDTAVWTSSMAGWGPIGAQAEFASAGAGGQDAVQVPVASVLGYPMATPWRRWCARLFDLWWEVVAVGLIASFVLAEISPAFLLWTETRSGGMLFDIACVPLALLLDAAVHAVAGNTPGKALLGLRVGLVHGRPLSFVQHLWRNLGLWISGFGLGLPLVGLFTMGRQHGRLNEGKQASYDGAGYRVRAKPIGWGRRAVFGAVFMLMFATLTGAEIVDRVENARMTARLKGPSFTWTNPATGRSASVAPHWEHAQQTTEDGLVLHQFTQHSEHAVLIIASEDKGELSLAQHAGSFINRLSYEWRMRDGDLEDFRGQASWTATGEKDDGKLRIQVRLVQMGDRVWRVVAIQSVPMEYTDELVNDLTGKLWDTVVPRAS